ncbi:MAG: hypothetical protein ACRBBZ_03880 [Nitrosopumilus sp.]
MLGLMDEGIPDVTRTESDGSTVVSLTALNGHNISFDIVVNAEGYPEGEDSFTVNADAYNQVLDLIDLELPKWIICIVLGGILMVGL